MHTRAIEPDRVPLDAFGPTSSATSSSSDAGMAQQLQVPGCLLGVDAVAEHAQHGCLTIAGVGRRYGAGSLRAPGGARGTSRPLQAAPPSC